MRTSMLLVGSVVLALAVGGCDTDGDRFTGVVTTTTPRLCLGAPDASGDCFFAAPDLVHGLRLDDCITVTYVASDSALPGPRGTVTKVEASSDC